MRIRFGPPFYLLGIIELSLHGSAFAEAPNPTLKDRLTFKVGAIYNDIDGTVTVRRAPLPTTPIDFDDVGLDEDQINPWVGLRWRFGERWALNFHYDRYDKDAKTVVEKEFNFDGVVYPFGARIDTNIRADAYVMDVSYSIFKQHNYEAGVGLGIHAFDMSTSIKGSIRIADREEQVASAEEDLIAPVPNFRLYGIYALNSRISFNLNAGWLGASYEDWDGRFLYIRGSGDYRFSKRWSVGLGFQYTDIDVEHDRNNGDFEEYEADLLGVQGYVSYSF